ncbi:hypothetical protein EPUS_00608 [Endocarpon pusillum Z07020]|uniref:Uncharacterized protein n=1 Tax=Endocarpon pusillum (strain Z07020 / HMAS-L-300199) TaxID=1263415 RepID=U1HR90_ENDPU|nr:uncharacterized protein EPUS_00608 [Endocarpon pusillum Z07020]ERF71619.1 hypothetical protein EPUS_00608 [Endocarpon pusillum Z07020]
MSWKLQAFESKHLPASSTASICNAWRYCIYTSLGGTEIGTIEPEMVGWWSTEEFASKVD